MGVMKSEESYFHGFPNIQTCLKRETTPKDINTRNLAHSFFSYHQKSFPCGGRVAWQ